MAILQIKVSNGKRNPNCELLTTLNSSLCYRVRKLSKRSILVKVLLFHGYGDNYGGAFDNNKPYESVTDQ